MSMELPPRHRVIEAAASIASFAGLVLAASRGETAWAVASAALYLAFVILYATRVVSQTIIATGIVTGAHRAGSCHEHDPRTGRVVES